MSNTSTFALGLGSGAALWYLTKSKHKSAPPPASSGTAAPTTITAPSATAATATARRNAEVRIDQAGIAVDGARVELAEAVRRCAAIGHASVTVAPNAPASTCAALMSALAAASVPTVRNLGRRNAKSQRPSDTSSTFTLVVFPEGIGAPPSECATSRPSRRRRGRRARPARGNQVPRSRRA